jgi:hypothetical protein
VYIKDKFYIFSNGACWFNIVIICSSVFQS